MSTEQSQAPTAEMRDTVQLTRKSALSSIIFQLFFDIAYIFLFIVIARTVFHIAVDFFDQTASYFHLTNAIAHVSYLSFIDLHAIFTLTGLLIILAFSYMVETHTLIIITSLHYRNEPISPFRAFFRACLKTPYILWLRIVQVRKHIYILTASYVIWKLIEQLLPYASFSQWITTGLFLYFAIIIFIIIFFYPMSTYVACLEENEQPLSFNDDASFTVRKKHMQSTAAFYIFLFLAIVIWFIVFSLIVKGLILLSSTYPSLISHILTFFITGTVISIFALLSLIKTIRTNMQTVAYHAERRSQHKITPVATPAEPSANKRATMVIEIIAVIIVGFTLMFSTLHPKVAQILSQAEEYAQENKDITPPHIPRSEKALANYIFSQNHTTIDLIENIILSYIAVFIQKIR